MLNLRTAAKTFLKVFATILFTFAITEALLALFGYPDGISRLEDDLRVFDPVLLYRLRPDVTLNGKRTPFFIHPEIRTNHLGLRDREFADPKPPRDVRMLSLGDSYAFGWGVKAEESYTKRLEQALNAQGAGQRYETINAGIASYESWRELELLKRLQPVLQPDLVICQVADNDLGPDAVAGRHANSLFPPWALNLLRHSRLLTIASTLYEEGTEGVKELLARARGVDTVARSEDELWNYMHQLAATNDSAFLRNPPWVERIVENYGRMNECAHGSFVCMLLPNHYQIYAQEYEDVANSILENKLRARGIHVLNLVGYLRRHNTLILCLADTHPNALGHQLIADTLVAYLTSTGMIDSVQGTN